MMEKFLYRPFFRRDAGSGSVLVASLGLSIIVQNLFALLFGNEIKTISRGIADSYHLGPIMLTEIQLLQFIISCIVVTIFCLATKHLNSFKAIWAMGDEAELIPVLGLPLFRLRSLVLILSSVCVAIPACLISIDVGMDPHMGMSYLLIAAVAVIAGGVNSYRGWILGSAILALSRSLALWKLSANWVDLGTFSFLIIILLLRPQGLLGSRSRLEETP